MTLIKIKRHDQIIPIYVLYRMVLDLVYAPEKMGMAAIDGIFSSIKEYERNFAWARANGILMSAVEEEVENVLMDIKKLMREDEEGALEARKQLFKDKGVDYKKFHRLPEAYNAKDFFQGQRALEEHIRENPEPYEGS